MTKPELKVDLMSGKFLGESSKGCFSLIAYGFRFYKNLPMTRVKVFRMYFMFT